MKLLQNKEKRAYKIQKHVKKLSAVSSRGEGIN